MESSEDISKIKLQLSKVLHNLDNIKTESKSDDKNNLHNLEENLL
jgi:hypothetical protein